MAAGNKHLEYKDLLNEMEVASPGSKHAFYFGFLDRAADLFANAVADAAAETGGTISPCEVCGSPSNNNMCSFCRLVELAGTCLLYTSPSPRDQRGSRMPSSA